MDGLTSWASQGRTSPMLLSVSQLWFWAPLDSCSHFPNPALKAFLMFLSLRCKTIFFFFCFHFPSGLDFYYMEKMDKQDLGGILCPFQSGFLGIPISPLASDKMCDMIHSGVCNHYPPPSSASPRAAYPPSSFHFAFTNLLTIEAEFNLAGATAAWDPGQ